MKVIYNDYCSKAYGVPEIWANVIQRASQAFSVAGQVLRYFHSILLDGRWGSNV